MTTISLMRLAPRANSESDVTDIKNDTWNASDDRNPDIEGYTEYEYSTQELKVKSGIRGFPTESDRETERERGPQENWIEEKSITLTWTTGGFQIAVKDSEGNPEGMTCLIRPEN